MAKFCGKIGFIIETEVDDGVWKEVAEERTYYGDVLKNRVNTNNQGDMNPNTSITTEISVLSDDYLNENFHMIRYVWFYNKRWIVTNYNIEYPRITLTLGGLYNG